MRSVTTTLRVIIDDDRKTWHAVRGKLKVAQRGYRLDRSRRVVSFEQRLVLLIAAAHAGAERSTVWQLQGEALGSARPVALPRLNIDHRIFLGDELLALEQELTPSAEFIGLVEAIDAAFESGFQMLTVNLVS